MIENGYALPVPDTGLLGYHPTPVGQMRRLKLITEALWESRFLFGGDDRIGITVSPDRDEVQISLHVHAPAELQDALRLVGRLGWDVEPARVSVGQAKHHRWYGMLGGFRAYVVWVQQPVSVGDTQGRADLPSGVGVGDAAADAAYADARRAEVPFGPRIPGGIGCFPPVEQPAPRFTASAVDDPRSVAPAPEGFDLDPCRCRDASEWCTSEKCRNNP